VTETGFSVPVTRIGSIICERSAPPGAATTRAFSQALSSYPGRSPPGSSMRASYSSPSYSLFVLIGPAVVSFHDSSLTTSRRGSVVELDAEPEEEFRESKRLGERGFVQPGREEPPVSENHAHGVSSLA
jgi:hypothetical protein